MAIEGIDRVTYGVADMARCGAFLADWGLEPAEGAEPHETWTTLNGCEVVIKPQDDPTLPPAIEDKPTIREVVWGVDDISDLDELRTRLSGAPGFRDEGDMLHAVDPSGLGIAFRVSRKRGVDVAPAKFNRWGDPARVDTASTVYDRARPIEVGHIVLFVRDVVAASAFYESIGFHLSDEYPGRGRFLRCAGRGGHHDLFLLETPEKRIGLNHVAFTVRDIHEVFGGGLHVSRCGWDTQLGPGRHPISSAYFWYFHNPAGGLIEYYSDEDYLTENWVPRAIEPGPTKFAEWAISGGLDGNSRRQRDAGSVSRAFLTE